MFREADMGGDGQVGAWERAAQQRHSQRAGAGGVPLRGVASRRVSDCATPPASQRP